MNLFDFGIAEDGTFYYVMELLEGLDAERIVNKFGPMPAGRVIHVIRQVCHSLSEAESISLVHRDIKPANIVLCRYGEDYDFVKVLDFGIVKAIQEPGTAEAALTLTALTAEHVVQGTPAFIAPEQVLGGFPVDNRADIYGTGCLTYWLLTGQRVFTGDTPMQLLIQHAQAVPDPPSGTDRIADSERTRCDRARVPGQESVGPSADRARTGAPARGGACHGRVDTGTRAGMVGHASTGRPARIIDVNRLALIPGASLGPYKILCALGAGGMGEVYRARDTRLDRTVAIKVLLDPIADDRQFRERFEREARIISQLTHPHICTLYDVGEHEGTAFLVMEFLEGETLADRLVRAESKGPGLPRLEALTIAIQIADALGEAHRVGVVHRDLKPANVMLTRSGAKLLDFGLAKTIPAVAAGGVSMF